jgi:dienelactone hydrolase
LVAWSLAARAGDGPVEFGRARLAAAGADAASVQVDVDPKLGFESFTIAPAAQKGRSAQVVGGDATGAMYGLLELAERARRDGKAALTSTTTRGAPFLHDRGLNVFLTLPWNYEKNDTELDPQALVDPNRWWFQNEDYWNTLLDQMAESRLNWLDVHGTWDVSVTSAPNLYAYFVQSDKYPEVGVAPEVKAKNLERLNWVIDHAHARGIRVSLMCYEARLTIPQNPHPPYPNDEATAYSYTREVVAKTIRGAPGLDAIGFRIGESGHGGDFFRCYGEAVADSGRDIPLVTRSWTTRKAKVVPLARASNDFTVEIKYDGEQWAAPYPFAGGRVASWHSYSFEDYLSDSSLLGEPNAAPKRLWPGQPIAASESRESRDADEKSRWPDEPYKIVWQVRANGTHRIFPFYEPEWVRRSIEPMKVGTASGYTIEPENAYYPASPKYYVADPSQVPCDWVHQRDELYLMQWGRLGYDPKTSDSVFEQRLRERFGPAATSLSKAWRAASHVVPLSLLSHAFGPDHRDHAPELEWGGNTQEWIEGEGLDTHSFLPIREELALRVTGGHDGRLGALDVAEEMDRLVATAESGLGEAKRTIGDAPEKGRARELRCAIEQLTRLGRYHAARLRSAWWSAIAEASPTSSGARGRARDQMALAAKAWDELAPPANATNEAAAFYKPFTERLRMHTNTFSWRGQSDEVHKELQALEELAKASGEAARPKESSAKEAKELHDERADRSTLPDAALSWRQEGADVVARVAAHGLDRAWLLTKPLPSSTFFHKVAMAKEGDAFVARVRRESCGHLLAAEIAKGEAVRRVPDPLRATPWLVVPSQQGPTPMFFSSEEALAHFDPASFDPAKYGTIVVAPRAWQFFHDFDLATQRKLLDAVSRGATLLVMQQDYTSGRYSLKWLPNAPKVENGKAELVDPGELGARLRLEVAHAPDLVFQHFVPTSGWELSADGALAHRQLGKGELWLVQARLTQNLHHADCSRMLLQLLRGSGEKPAVIVDAGTELNHFATSLLPDFLNAHELSFLTLGEVVARESNAGPLASVPGRAWDDLVLGGRGAAMQQQFVDAQAKAAAARPLATTKEEFESQRAAQKLAVMRSLGLDPLPERTPLNARVVGTTNGDGYRVDRVVFESRPGFPVSALVYRPALATGSGGKLPVIVHAHGHWAHKKSDPTLQQVEIQQALHGYLAMIVDTPGFSFEGDAKIERRYAGTHFDLRNTLGSMNTTAVYVWDLMRALDYLATRPDADVSRVGITGASGGGLATLWAFAADDRFTCAIPVCFPTSLEIEPHNGCQCNHVPGTLRIGDRADALAVRAPAPVMVMGADDDREFPPAGTQKTGEKLKALWSLFGRQDDTAWRVFHSGHDYNLEMCGAALGFFDRHLRGVGDGSPVKLEPKPTLHADDPSLFCFDDAKSAAPGLTSMRDLAVAKLQAAMKRALPAGEDAIASYVAFNGGLPHGAATKVVVHDETGAAVEFPRSPADAEKLAGRKFFLTFESEPGLVVPGVLWLPRAAPRGAVVLVSDAGKATAEPTFNVSKLVLGGFACLAIDPRGLGELDGIDLRLLVYRNQSPAFAAAIDVNRALELMRSIAPRIGVVADGPTSSLAALDAALVTPDVSAVIGRNSMREFSDAFDDKVPLTALQPQADLLAPLSRLRADLKAPAFWTYAGDRGFDLYAAVLRLMRL